MKLALPFLPLLCAVSVVGCTPIATEPTTPATHSATNDDTTSTGIIGLEPAARPTRTPLAHWSKVDRVLELVKHVDQAAEKGVPILVHFTAQWCTDCLALEDNVLGSKAVATQLVGVHRVIIDVTSVTDESQQLLAIFSVKGLPTIIYYDDAVPLAGFLMAPDKAPQPKASATILESVAASELLRLLKKSL